MLFGKNFGFEYIENMSYVRHVAAAVTGTKARSERVWDRHVLKNQIYVYLGYYTDRRRDISDELIDDVLGEVEKLSRFVYRYEYFDSPPDFLSKEPSCSVIRAVSYFRTSI